MGRSTNTAQDTQHIMGHMASTHGMAWDIHSQHSTHVMAWDTWQGTYGMAWATWHGTGHMEHHGTLGMAWDTWHRPHTLSIGLPDLLKRLEEFEAVISPINPKPLGLLSGFYFLHLSFSSYFIP